jgi:hypothetical protein
MKHRRQLLLDIRQEDRAIHRAVDNHGRDQAIVTKRRHECGGLPVAVWHLRDEPLPATTAAVTAAHVRGSPILSMKTNRRESRLGISACQAARRYWTSGRSWSAARLQGPQRSPERRRAQRHVQFLAQFIERRVRSLGNQLLQPICVSLPLRPAS